MRADDDVGGVEDDITHSHVCVCFCTKCRRRVFKMLLHDKTAAVCAAHMVAHTLLRSSCHWGPAALCVLLLSSLSGVSVSVLSEDHAVLWNVLLHTLPPAVIFGSFLA